MTQGGRPRSCLDCFRQDKHEQVRRGPSGGGLGLVCFRARQPSAPVVVRDPNSGYDTNVFIPARVLVGLGTICFLLYSIVSILESETSSNA